METSAARPSAAALPWRTELEPEEVRARFRWAREHGHPHYHWPDVPVHAWRGALAELERIAREVLRGDVAPCDAAGPHASRALGVAGFTSGLGPLVGRWIEDGLVRADPLTAAVFGLHLAHGRARAERMSLELRRAVGALETAGAKPIVVKSAHTAEYFPEPGARPAVDLDLVVCPERLDAAERALQRTGYALAARQLRPRKSDWLAPGAAPLPRSLELLHAESQYAVDLHGSLERNFFGVRSVCLARVVDAPTRSGLALGTELPLLRQPLLTAYLALHASEGLANLTLLRMVELVLVIRRDTASGALRWVELLELLAQHDAARFAFPAFALTERLAPGTVDEAALREIAAAATPRMRRVIGALAPARAQRLEQLSIQERFMWCGSPREYARRAAHMLLPAPVGRSVPRLMGKYLERAYRLVRGKVVAR